MQKPLGLYIHWPFCLSKCPYCDFNSHVREKIDQQAWHDALVRELKVRVQEAQNHTLVSIFFGGGTPSLMPPETIRTLIDLAKDLWPHSDNLEITLEANPGTVDAQVFEKIAAAGVNRLSMGIQSLRDDDLKFLGRRHNAAEAKQAIMLARDLFSRFSFDLIYARPNHTWAAWEEELEEALAFGAKHLSLYQLTIEEGTTFHAAHRRGEWILPTEEVSEELFDRTHALMTARGLPAYEISNFAQVGQECQHNVLYWRYQDYLGIGPGAHGRLYAHGERFAQRNHRAPEIWLERVQQDGTGLTSNLSLTRQEQLEEYLMMSLRLVEGLNILAFENYFGQSLETLIEPDRLEALVQEGLLERTLTHLRLTHNGLKRHNAVLRYLINTSSHNA